MNNPTKIATSKAEDRKKRLEAALKRNILRRKAQASQRSQTEAQPIVKTERGPSDDNV